jgi:hypothetical protein
MVLMTSPKADFGYFYDWAWSRAVIGPTLNEALW